MKHLYSKNVSYFISKPVFNISCKMY